MIDNPLVVDDQTFEIKDGEFVEAGSWVYVWLRPTVARDVVYVGATGLPPAARFWLHLHHDDPRFGRIRTDHPEALSGDVVVRGFRLDPSLDRKLVKHAVVALLDGEQPGGGLSDETLAAAAAIVERLTAASDARPIDDEPDQLIASAEARVQIVEGVLDAVDHWSEIGELISSSNTIDDARRALTRPPFNYTATVASHVLDTPLRRLSLEARSKLTIELGEIRAFLEASQPD